MAIIDIKHLTKDYGSNRGIFDLSFSLEKGQVLGFLGPNGAGKTTTIRHLLGYSRPQAGSCQILGLNCFSQADQIAKQVGYLPGESSFMEEMTGQAFIHFLGQLRAMTDFSRADELSRFFDFDPHIRISKMSKGTKQKLALICAFMHDPQIYILDEPTSGLDPLMQQQFVKLIGQEKAQSKTILMSSHLFEEIEKTCDRVAIIRQGRLLTISSIDSLQEKQEKVFEITFANAQQAAAFAKDYDCQFKGEKDLRVRLRGDMSQFLQDLAHHQASNLKQIPQHLEQVFLHYYGGDQDESNPL